MEPERNIKIAGDPGVTTRPSNYAAVLRVVHDVLERRTQGEICGDLDIVAAHPDLAPDLQEALDGLRMVQQATSAARKTVPSSPRLPLPLLPLAELDAPIEASAFAENDDAVAEEEPASPDVPGYTVYREMITGGQATVFKAMQDSTGRIVAVKVLPGGRLAGSTNRGRFEREAEILARLNHPNIVGIVDRGRTSAGAFFLVMPFVDGRPLDSFAGDSRGQGAEGIHRLLRTFVKLARAVGEAHDLGVVHRDLKPSNVLVDARDEPHLLDFGLARWLDGAVDWRVRTITRAGEVVGSLPWASPEQVSGESADADARSDVYALGVCLFNCLTGHHPYDINGSITDLVQRICRAQPARLSQVKGASRDTLQRVLDRCLAKSPTERYTDAGAFAADLDSLLAGRSVARPVSFFTRRRGPLALAALTVLPLAVLVMICGRTFLPHQTSATVFELPSMGNGIGMTLVKIPAGAFRMGTSDKAAYRGDDERAHDVTITQPFWIATREVTEAQFAEVMSLAAPSPKSASLPAIGIPWTQAQEFCRRLSIREGALYRLPTEAEWERACRAGHEGSWSGTGEVDDAAWHSGNSDGHPHAVGLKLPNQWGLYDMHGNAAEWCVDFYNPIYPVTRNDPVYRDRTANHVTRGGSFARPAAESRSAARGREPRDTMGADIGFRVVMDLPAGSSTATQAKSADHGARE